MLTGKLSAPQAVTSQPATDYVVDRVVLDFNKSWVFIELRHLNAEGAKLLDQVVEEPLTEALAGSLVAHVLALLKAKGAIV